MRFSGVRVQFAPNLSKFKFDMTLTLDDFDLILNVHFIPPATPGLFSPSMSLIGVS